MKLISEHEGKVDLGPLHSTGLCQDAILLGWVVFVLTITRLRAVRRRIAHVPVTVDLVGGWRYEVSIPRPQRRDDNML